MLRQGFPALSELLAPFMGYMIEKQSAARDTAVNHLRKAILRRCIGTSRKPSGVFSLTVPMGGGKTLSSMAFALHHAATHDHQRIIYVIPYTSIIEQTAEQFREIFGEVVVEHHSNLDAAEPDGETARSRLACENWDAPLIVTTSVQFFESLFASRTSRCRKLHNIAKSVVGAFVEVHEVKESAATVSIPFCGTGVDVEFSLFLDKALIRFGEDLWDPQ